MPFEGITVAPANVPLVEFDWGKGTVSNGRPNLGGTAVLDEAGN